MGEPCYLSGKLPTQIFDGVEEIIGWVLHKNFKSQKIQLRDQEKIN